MFLKNYLCYLLLLLCCSTLYIASGSDEHEYETCLREASTLIGDSSIDLLKFSLAVRAHSPAVVAYHQVGRNSR